MVLKRNLFHSIMMSLSFLERGCGCGIKYSKPELMSGQEDKYDKYFNLESESDIQTDLYLCPLPLLLQLEGEHPDSVRTSSCCETTKRHCHLPNSWPRGEQEETPVPLLNRICQGQR